MLQIAARLAVHSPSPVVDNRRAARAEVALVTNMLQIGYHGIDVVVRDISELGFRIDAPMKVKTKSLVRLRLPGLGMVLGRVVWCRKGQIGGEFVNPIGPLRLRQLIGYRGFSVVETDPN